MTNKNLFLFLKISLALILLQGCGRSHETQKQDVVLESYRLIDSQRTDEAIELLEDALKNDPENYDYQATLASAYAHKSGIKIQRLIPAVNQISKTKLDSDLINQIESNSPLISKIDKNILVFIGSISKISRYLQIFDSLPTIEKNQKIYLEQAIGKLNDLGGRIKPEDAIYRAALEIILFKHIFNEELLGQPLAVSEKETDTCHVDLLKLNSTVSSLGKLLIDIFGDIGFANPNQAESMKKLAEQTSQSILNISNTITTVTAIDEASNLFLKQSLIQSSFGKILKCGGS